MLQSLRTAVLLLLLPLAGVASAQTSVDTGAVTLTASVSGYVDLAAGGTVGLTGHVGGSVSGTTSRGAPLASVTVALGDVSPVNTNPVVRATVPLRLRSNIAYALSVSSTGISSADPQAVQSADVGFGIGNVRRVDQGVHAAGTDSPAAQVSGDPSTDADFDPATPRFDFAPSKSLAYLATSRTVLSGARIMDVVPPSAPGGLLVDAYFVVRPQFFSPGAFTTQVTFTISTP